MLGGELDTWTPPVDAPKVLAEIGGHARFIELANSTHVVGEGDTPCGSTLVRGFVQNPQAIGSLDASCAPAVSPIHTVGVYPTRLSEQPPIEPSPGNSATPADLQLAAVAISTAGDAVARYTAIEAKVDHGLAGGTVTAKHNAVYLRPEPASAPGRKARPAKGRPRLSLLVQDTSARLRRSALACSVEAEVRRGRFMAAQSR